MTDPTTLLMPEDDLRVIRQFIAGAPGTPDDRWRLTWASIETRDIDGVAALEALFTNAPVVRGWVVRTDAVLDGTDNVWTRTSDGQRDTESTWNRLLCADLTYKDNRGLRLEHAHGHRWCCQEVIENDRCADGERLLANDVSYYTMAGKNDLHYRVYWGLRQTLVAPGQPSVWQPVASRLLAAGAE